MTNNIMIKNGGPKAALPICRAVLPATFFRPKWCKCRQ